ncbi:MAG: SH3 domain-containing protein [Leptonema sp. (in: bacteria)]
MHSQEYIQLFKKSSKEKLYVIKQGSVLRTEPSIYSFEVSLLNLGEAVDVLYKTNQKEVIGNSKSYWYYVKTERGLVGWIFGSLLSKTKVKEEEYFFDPKLVVNIIEGTWWEVNERGETGYRSLEIKKNIQNPYEGILIYKFSNQEPQEIKYTISDKGIVLLEKALPIGKEIFLYETYNEHRIYFQSADKKQIFFKKAVIIEDSNEKND